MHPWVGACAESCITPAIGEVRRDSGGEVELLSAREDLAAALKRRRELHAELESMRAELAATHAELEDVQSCQRSPKVLELRQEIRRLRATLPAKTGDMRCFLFHRYPWKLHTACAECKRSLQESGLCLHLAVSFWRVTCLYALEK